MRRRMIVLGLGNAAQEVQVLRSDSSIGFGVAVRGWHLPAIVHRLKSEYAWLICTDYSKPNKVALYSLPPDVDRAKLRLHKSAMALGQTESGR